MSNNLPDQDLDLSFLYEIADGSDEFIVESIGMFLQQTPDLLQTISSGIASQNWPVVASASHKLKPNLGFFGMPLSQATIQEVELMAKAGAENPEELIAKFAIVNQSVSANLIELEKIKAEKEAGL